MAKSFFTSLFLLLLIALQSKAQDDLTNRIFKLAYNQHYDSATILLSSNQSLIDASSVLPLSSSTELLFIFMTAVSV